jgi:hypothetical protein
MRRPTVLLLGLALMLAIGLSASTALADVSSDGSSTSTNTTSSPLAFTPTITSDQTDYSPGSTVTLSGTGWAAGEVVHVTVVDSVNDSWSWATSPDTVADLNGAFTVSLTLPDWSVASYAVTATGSSGAVAATAFTDSQLLVTPGPTGDGVTFTVSWTAYTNSSCTTQTSPAHTGTLAITGDSGNNLSGYGGPASYVKITAPPNATTPSGWIFKDWGTDTTVPGDPYSICVPTPSASQSLSHTANYKLADTTAPTIAFSKLPNGSNGWFTTAPAVVTVTATDTDDGGVASLACKLDGTPTTITNPGSTSTTMYGDVSTSIDGDHTVSCQAADSTGNTAAYANNTIDLKLDTAAPTGGSISVTAGYNTTGTVPVSVTNATDATPGSGIASNQVQHKLVTLSGGACGDFSAATWQDVSLAAGNDTVASGNCVEYRLVATDNAGNSATFGPTSVVKLDTTPPTGGALSVAAGYNTTGTVPVSVTDASDAESGIASNHVQRKLVTLSGGTCGDFSAATWQDVSLSGGNDTVASGNCVEYRLVATDNAGNSATFGPSGVVKVDTTPPTLSLTPNTTDSYDYLSGSTVYYNPSSGNSGSFTVTATTSDPESGIDHVAFPTVFGSDGGNVSSSPYQKAYSWTDTATASGSQTVTSYDGASLHTDKTFTITPDTSPPTGGSVSYADGYDTTGTVAVSYTDATDSGSGIASNTLDRELGTLSGGLCDFTGSSWTPAALDGSGNDTVANGKCAKYRLVATDNVSNQAIFDSSSVVKVDTTPPTGGGLSVSAGYNTTGTVPVSVTDATDPESGVASEQLQRKIVTLSGGSCGDFSSATWANVTLSAGSDTVASGDCVEYQLVATDNAGNSATFGPSGVVKVDTTPPSLSLSLVANDGYDYVSGSTVFYNPSSGNSGSFTVSATTSDPESGIDHVAFPTVFGSDGGNVANSPYQTTYSWTDTATGSGSKTVSSYDGAGLSTDKSFTLTPDTTPPTGGSVSYADGYNTTGAVMVSVTDATDSGSGIASNQLQRELGTLSGGSCDFSGGSWAPATLDGSGDDTVASGKCAKYRLVTTDNVSNQAIFDSSSVVKVDTTPPVITFDHKEPAPNGNAAANGIGWNDSSVTVYWTCSDPESGVLASPITQSVTTEGYDQKTTGTCINAASLTASNDQHVNIDETPPVITATATKADNTPYTAGTWTNESVTVGFSCVDTGPVQSGINTDTLGGGGTVSSDTSVSGTTFNNSGSCVDNAGNPAVAASFGPVKVDKTPPTASHTIGIPSYTAGGNVYVTSATQLAFTVGDALSGFKDCTITVTKPDASTVNTSSCANGANDYYLNGTLLGTANDGTYGNAVSVHDNAGNSNSDSFNVILDNTPPAITLTTPASSSSSSPDVYSYASVPNASYSCSDGSGSGVAATGGCVGKVDGMTTVASGNHLVSTLGPHTFTVTSKDNLGNTTSVTHYYDVVASTSFQTGGASNYNGQQYVNQGATFLLGDKLTSAASSCVSGKPVGFALGESPTSDPLSQTLVPWPGAFPATPWTAATDSSGQATVSATAGLNWAEGPYDVLVNFAGTASYCGPASDQGTLVVTSPGDSANGGGWYTLGGSGHSNFGFVIHKVPNTSPAQYKGELLLINTGKWRLKGTLNSYAKSGSSASASGTGDLYWWDTSNPSYPLGYWHQTSDSPVSFSISFAAGTSKTTGALGIIINHSIQPGEPSNLPNSSPVAIKGGDINVN